jgi:hypothetical protein
MNERGYVKHGVWWVFVFIIQFIVPMTLVFINLVISMNSFRLVHIESYQRRSPIPHKRDRDRDRVPLCNNGTDLLVRRLVGRSASPLGGIYRYQISNNQQE